MSSVRPDGLVERLASVEEKLDLVMESTSAMLRVLTDSMFPRAADVAEQPTDNDALSEAFLVSGSVGGVPSQGCSGGQGSKRSVCEASSLVDGGNLVYSR